MENGGEAGLAPEQPDKRHPLVEGDVPPGLGGGGESLIERRIFVSQLDKIGFGVYGVSRGVG